jgi:hypothetical protein
MPQNHNLKIRRTIMKTSAQTPSNGKTAAIKGIKAAKRSTKAKATSSLRSARRVANGSQATVSGYSDQARRLIKRGKAAFSGASTWASDTASALPKATRNIRMPNQRAVTSFMNEQPLVIGAVGLGLGVVLGAMLPPMANKSKPRRRK